MASYAFNAETNTLTVTNGDVTLTISPNDNDGVKLVSKAAPAGGEARFQEIKFGGGLFSVHCPGSLATDSSNGLRTDESGHAAVTFE